MNGGRGRSEIGIAMLETAALVVVLSAFGFAAAGLAGYLFELQSVRAMVDELVLAGKVRPYVLESTGEGRVELRLDSRGIEEFLSRAATEMSERSEKSGEASAMTFVEAGYVVLRIDSRSGGYLGIESGPVRAASRGRPPSDELSDCPSLAEQFKRAAAHPGHGVSHAAIPTAIHSGGSSGANFLPTSVLIGVRVLKDLRKTSAGALLGLVSDSLVVSGCKVELLRGEIG